MSPVKLDTGPPKMRSPGGKPGQRKMSVDWTTVNICPSAPPVVQHFRAGELPRSQC